MPKPATLPPNVAAQTPAVPNVLPNVRRTDPRPPTPSPGHSTRPNDPNYGDDAKFTSILNPTVGFLWAAAVQQYAYVNAPTQLTALKALIGADDITQIQGLSDLAPNGLRIKYPDTTIFVIQGTTREVQADAYGSGGGGNFDAYDMSASGPVKGAARSDRENYLGTFFNPIMEMALPWVNVIGAYMDGEGKTEGRRVYVVGHSLGASVCEILAILASYGQGLNHAATLIAGGAMESYMRIANWRERFGGGYVFGKPKVFTYGVTHSDYFPTKVPREGSYVQSMTPRGELCGRVRVYNQPRDPIRLILANRAEAPFYMQWKGATNPRDLGELCNTLPEYSFPQPTSFSPGVSDQGSFDYYYPPWPSQFISDMEMYHGIKTYINAVVRRVENRYGTVPNHYLNLVNAALIVTTDEVLKVKF